MTHNDLKKGMRVKGPGMFGHGPRYARIMETKKGIRQMLEIEESNGHYGDMGDTYIDEITHVEIDGEWQPVELSPAHAKQMGKIRGFMRGLP